MGKVVVSQFISLDGVIEDPGGSEDHPHGGWSFKFNRGEDGDKFKLDEVMASDVLLLGRKTYQGFAGAWPSMTDEDGFADKFNSMPKYVVSTTLGDDDASWNNSTVIRHDLAGAVGRLTEQYSGDILINGSGKLIASLAEQDLIDEYRLMTFPVVLGSGQRLFADSEAAKTMRLAETKPVGPDGVIVLTYELAR
ncbi:dihydrofolate reductase family protein [soil metagenome]